MNARLPIAAALLAVTVPTAASAALTTNGLPLNSGRIAATRLTAKPGGPLSPSGRVRAVGRIEPRAVARQSVSTAPFAPASSAELNARCQLHANVVYGCLRDACDVGAAASMVIEAVAESCVRQYAGQPAYVLAGLSTSGGSCDDGPAHVTTEALLAGRGDGALARLGTFCAGEQKQRPALCHEACSQEARCEFTLDEDSQLIRDIRPCLLECLITDDTVEFIEYACVAASTSCSQQFLCH